MKLFGVTKPNGTFATMTELFTNRPEAAAFAVLECSDYVKANRRLGKDGSDLDWKKMKRQGWKIVPVSLVVAE